MSRRSTRRRRTPIARAARAPARRASSSRFRPRPSTASAPTRATADAVRRIFAAKGRPADHPVIVHVRGRDATSSDWARDVPAGAQALADAFWPGPLTLILPRAAHVATRSPAARTASACACRRIRSRTRCSLRSRVGGDGIAAPSANRFGHMSPTTAQHVADDLGDAVAMILDGGACDVGIESTIVAFAADRAGAAAARRHRRRRAVARAWRASARRPDADAPRASGTLASHYAPRTPAFLVAADLLRAEIAQRDERDEARRGARAARSTRPADFDGVWMRRAADAAPYAHDLYANLRALDAAERRRDPDRGGAGRRRVARRARPAVARDARRGRRSRLEEPLQRPAPAVASPRAPAGKRTFEKRCDRGDELLLLPLEIVVGACDRELARARVLRSVATRAGAVSRTGGISVSATMSSTGCFGGAANAPNMPIGTHASTVRRARRTHSPSMRPCCAKRSRPSRCPCREGRRRRRRSAPRPRQRHGVVVARRARGEHRHLHGKRDVARIGEPGAKAADQSPVRMHAQAVDDDDPARRGARTAWSGWRAPSARAGVAR